MLGISDWWVDDCMRWRGEVLHGIYAHSCLDWDGLPVDETCNEWPCVCFTRLRTRLIWRITRWWRL